MKSKLYSLLEQGILKKPHKVLVTYRSLIEPTNTDTTIGQFTLYGVKSNDDPPIALSDTINLYPSADATNPYRTTTIDIDPTREVANVFYTLINPDNAKNLNCIIDHIELISEQGNLPIGLGILEPEALPATLITTTGFTANWTEIEEATGYKIDVSTDIEFTTFVTNYENKDIPSGATVSLIVTGMAEDTCYFYRVRAYNASFTSKDSNDIHVKTTSGVVNGITPGNVYNDSGYFNLPYTDEATLLMKRYSIETDGSLTLEHTVDTEIPMTTNRQAVELKTDLDGNAYFMTTARTDYSVGTYYYGKIDSAGVVTKFSISYTASVDIPVHIYLSPDNSYLYVMVAHVTGGKTTLYLYRLSTATLTDIALETPYKTWTDISIGVTGGIFPNYSMIDSARIASFNTFDDKIFLSLYVTSTVYLIELDIANETYGWTQANYALGSTTKDKMLFSRVGNYLYRLNHLAWSNVSNFVYDGSSGINNTCGSHNYFHVLPAINGNVTLIDVHNNVSSTIKITNGPADTPSGKGSHYISDTRTRMYFAWRSFIPGDGRIVGIDFNGTTFDNTDVTALGTYLWSSLFNPQNIDSTGYDQTRNGIVGRTIIT
jgi:hypothetical protein